MTISSLSRKDECPEHEHFSYCRTFSIVVYLRTTVKKEIASIIFKASKEHHIGAPNKLIDLATLPWLVAVDLAMDQHRLAAQINSHICCWRLIINRSVCEGAVVQGQQFTTTIVLPQMLLEYLGKDKRHIFIQHIHFTFCRAHAYSKQLSEFGEKNAEWPVSSLFSRIEYCTEWDEVNEKWKKSEQKCKSQLSLAQNIKRIVRIPKASQ